MLQQATVLLRRRQGSGKLNNAINRSWSLLEHSHVL